MKVLVIGSGAREHAIIQALARSSHKPELFCYGSFVNPGIRQFSSAYQSGDVTDCEAILKMAKTWGINLAIIGPEAPLEQGLADAFWQAKIPCVGPKKKLAQIETSKAFTRDLMKKYHINGLPKYRSFKSLDEGILDYIQELGEGNYVIKANGLMGGKGVKISGEHLHSEEEALAFCEEIFKKKQSLVIEEKLIGQEFSLMCFVDGIHLIPMPLVQDHKRAYKGDTGPNTGGMGSYSDANHSLPFLSNSEVIEAFTINQAVVDALHSECNEAYIGVLYGSFIATKRGVFVIEFNARFGDPEALNVLSILETDFLEICQSMVQSELKNALVRFANQATVCKYLVPKGYPDNPIKDFPIDLSMASSQISHLYLASVNEVEKQLLGTGGRAAAFVGVADSLYLAEQAVEEVISSVHGPMYYREDIGTEALIQTRIDEMQRIRKA